MKLWTAATERRESADSGNAVFDRDGRICLIVYCLTRKSCRQCDWHLLSADDDPETNGKGHLLKLGFRHGDHRGNDDAADLSLKVRVSRDVRIAGAGYTHPWH